MQTLVLLALLVFVAAIIDHDRTDYTKIYLREHTISLATKRSSQDTTLEGHRQFIVKFNAQDVLSASHELLKADFQNTVGVQLGQYVPHHSFMIFANSEQVEKATKYPSVSFVQEYLPQYKFSQKESTTLRRISRQRSENIIMNVIIVDETQLATYKAEIQESLNLNNIKCKVTALTQRIQLECDQTSVLSAYKTVAQFSYVYWIDEDLPVETTNRNAKWITQTGKQDIVLTSASGLTGKGQIVAIGDSGLDTDSCYFYDSNAPVPFENVTKDVNHRKLVSYYSFMDNQDRFAGHGTHVVGTVAGNYPVQGHILSEFNGIASEAKIAFMDVGCSTTGGCNCTGIFCPCQNCQSDTSRLYLPTDLYNGYYKWAYDKGARIHSNSLGSSQTAAPYSSKSADADRFVYDYPDFLPVYSAGNDGRYGGMTVSGGPQQAKNVLTVGSSSTSSSGWMDVMDTIDYASNAKNLISVFRLNPNATAEQICSADMSTNCQYLFSQSKRYYVNAWGFGNYFTQTCCRNCSQYFLQSPKASIEQSQYSISPSSSYGPTRDGRQKPEIVAPGNYIVSAKSTETKKCGDTSVNDNLVAKSGTSMAAPVVAGLAAIVRQYFADGYYPSGIADTNGQYKNPSSALVKAILIASARPLNGSSSIEERYPDFMYHMPFSTFSPTQQRTFFGWGLVQLDNALKVTDSKNGLWVTDGRSLSTTEQHVYTLDVLPSSGEISITLVWTDPPGSPAVDLALVNDLDLSVTVIKQGKETTYYGNWLLNTTPLFDRVNNVEKVLLYRVSEPTSFRITVQGYNVPQGPQKYALVVAGSQFNDVTSVNSGRWSTGVIIGLVVAALVAVAALVVVLLLIARVVSHKLHRTKAPIQEMDETLMKEYLQSE